MISSNNKQISLLVDQWADQIERIRGKPEVIMIEIEDN